MQVTITDDNKFLILRNLNNYELNSVREFFTKEPDNSWVVKKKNPWFETKTSFLNNFGMLPIGLWTELVRYAYLKNVRLDFDPKINEILQDTKIEFNTFKYYVDGLFEKAVDENGNSVEMRSYQLEGVFKLLKFRKACVEVTTSGGKTLMSYILFKFLRDVKQVKKTLYIVPNKNLAVQSYEKYDKYEDWVQGSHNYLPAYLCGDMPKKQREKVPNADVLFATYQSLANIKENEFFDKFDSVIVDECLHPSTLITMEDGSKKPICEVKEGDKVWTFNEKKRIKEILPVKEVFRNLSKHEKMYEIELEDHTVLKITGNHKVLTKNRGYVRVDKLNENDDILNFYFSSNHDDIKSIKEIEYKGDVFNLHIDSPNDDCNHNYFANDICVSNCHHSRASTIKRILKRCHNTKYVFGMTGTFPKEDSFDRFVIESFIGPLVFKLTAFELINVHKAATPIYVINTYLNYASESEKKMLYESRKMKDKDDVGTGMRLLEQEMMFVNKNYNRMKYICDLVAKSKQNTLVLFNEVKDSKGYGRKIFEYLKENTDKTVFYADGHTDAKTRDYYNKRMDEDETCNTVIVGSQGTYSEGIDIANIGIIILAESFKSENILRQSIGRGMRLGNKEKVVMFDIIDDLRYGEDGDKDWLRNNYLWKQHLERTKAYKEHQFPVYEQHINFSEEPIFDTVR